MKALCKRTKPSRVAHTSTEQIRPQEGLTQAHSGQRARPSRAAHQYKREPDLAKTPRRHEAADGPSHPTPPTSVKRMRPQESLTQAQSGRRTKQPRAKHPAKTAKTQARRHKATCKHSGRRAQPLCAIHISIAHNEFRESPMQTESGRRA